MLKKLINLIGGQDTQNFLRTCIVIIVKPVPVSETVYKVRVFEIVFYSFFSALKFCFNIKNNFLYAKNKILQNVINYAL